MPVKFTPWKIFSLVAAVVVSGGLLVLATRNVKFAELGEILAHADLRWLPLMIAICFADLAIRSYRWKLLLGHAAPEARLFPLIKIVTVGLSINNVVMFRIGELVRAYLGGVQLQISTFTTLATIFVERLMDVAALAFIFAAASLVHPADVRGFYIWAAFALVAGIAVSLTFLAATERLLETSEWAQFLRRSHTVHRALLQAARGAQALRHPRAAFGAVSLSVILWLMDASLYWAGGRAIGLEPALDYSRSIFVLSSAAMSATLPAVPGSFGAFEQAVRMVLVNVYRIDPTTALAYGTFVHVVNYLIVTPLGIFLLYQMGHTLASLRRASE